MGDCGLENRHAEATSCLDGEVLAGDTIRAAGRSRSTIAHGGPSLLLTAEDFSRQRPPASVSRKMGTADGRAGVELGGGVAKRIFQLTEETGQRITVPLEDRRVELGGACWHYLGERVVAAGLEVPV